MYNGWKKLKHYSASGEDNLQYATANGMPSWFTLNFRASVQIIKQVQLQAGIENILDHRYRTFASGISGAGRNVFVTLRLSI
jgi:hemoglobin/transferrin/lactoferrin receptor protein